VEYQFYSPTCPAAVSHLSNVSLEEFDSVQTVSEVLSPSAREIVQNPHHSAVFQQGVDEV
jgi:hypothetical protein